MFATAELEAEVSDMLAPFARETGESPYEVHSALQECMGKFVGIFRTQADLEAGLETLRALQARAKNIKVEGSRMYNPGWHLVRDLRNLLTVSESITRSAMLRKESRGAHSRLDYTAMDPALSTVNICTALRGDTMTVEPTALPAMPPELKALFDAAPAPAPKKEAVT